MYKEYYVEMDKVVKETSTHPRKVVYWFATEEEAKTKICEYINFHGYELRSFMKVKIEQIYQSGELKTV